MTIIDHFTALGPERLRIGFRILRFDVPLWVFSVIGLVVAEGFKRAGLGFLQRSVKEVMWRMDRSLRLRRAQRRAFAGAYPVVAIKKRACS